LSEYLLFSIAYIISAVMTISLLCIFIQRLLKNREATLYIGGLLTAMYIFIFVLLQMKNYALLAGTIGLFVILSCVMHISSKQLPKQQ
ncbi:MAG: inner membrane CreD family protein, partial [Bacteroidales bacterium]|nr:inner membrane CreD family protein [Bacteroidales bacterium]